MISRIWHGKTNVEDANAYLQFLVEKGTKEYQQIPGNLSVKIWRHFDKDCCHFYTVSEWDELKSIEAFTGADISKAKYYPEDDIFLLEFERTVRHYETFIVGRG